MNINIDMEFLRETVEARRWVGKWLNERPNRGLDVTDVATLCAGYDMLANIIRQLTGEDVMDLNKQMEYNNVQVTFLELDQ